MISQGLALAVLAWLQTLPEFAVEAVIAWEAGQDPSVTHLAIANFTGAIRLLIGLGWPMIYFAAATSASFKRRRHVWTEIHLDDEHAIEVMGLLPPLLYFIWIWYKGSLSLLDAAVLTVFYAAYLFVLWRVPARAEGRLEDLLLRAVGCALPLRVPRKSERLLLGSQDNK